MAEVVDLLLFSSLSDDEYSYDAPHPSTVDPFLPFDNDFFSPVVFPSSPEPLQLGLAFGFDSDAEGDEYDPQIPNFLGDSDSRDEEFEWEEVTSRLDVLSMMVGHDRDSDRELVENVDWEVLLAVNDELVYASEYEVLSGQHDGFSRTGTPTARSVIEMLPSVVPLEGTSCAVCKEEFLLGGEEEEEEVKRLPCSHCYHSECILPWLKERNTCPVCRRKLPTDAEECQGLSRE
ncbi:putative transcription factor C2H2 family [Dioscorea sansibarensis]